MSRPHEQKRSYQKNFSELCAHAMYDTEGRRRKAKTMLAVLRHFFDKDTHALSLLDIGTSTGIIADHLAVHFREVVGIDIDAKALASAKASHRRHNLAFVLGDAMRLPFHAGSFDAVICAQIYEHVPDATMLMSEIRRVLKSEGACYFAAGNRLMFMEPHYRLPLLSVMPRRLAHLYLRLFGRGSFYYEKHLTYWGLKQLVGDYQVIDYTKKIVTDPQRFHADYMIRPKTLKARSAAFLLRNAYWLSPGYVWILRKCG